MSEWKPYRPPGYPIADSIHNPYVRIDPISGACARDAWEALGKPTDEHVLRAKLADLKGDSERDVQETAQTRSNPAPQDDFWSQFA